MPRYKTDICLIILAVALRVIGSVSELVPNFQILPALLLLIIWNWKITWQRGMMIAFLTWFCSDLLISLINSYAFLSWDQLGVLCYFTISQFLLNLAKRFQPDIKSVIVLSLLSAILFYVITNTVSYFVLASLYPRTLWGFWQAQWSGPDGYGPTWCFLKNGIIANVIAGALFLLAQSRFCIYHIFAKERFFVRL